MLNKPIVGMAVTPSGNGYWFVASDGGIFAYGDAQFHGSTGTWCSTSPSSAWPPRRTGNGYWMVASDGVVSHTVTPASTVPQGSGIPC